MSHRVYSGRPISIVLGTNALSAAAGVFPEKFPIDTFIVKAESSQSSARIFIAGVDDPVRDPFADMRAKRSDCGPLYARATIFGVYDFLERFAGCRFYFPGELGEIVPRHASLTVPVGEIVETPAYEKRMWNLLVSEHVNRWFDDPSYSRRDWTEYAFRCGLQMRRSTQTGAPCHGTRFHYYKDRFEKTHPEYFRARRLKDGTVHRCVEDAWNRGGFCWTSGIDEEIYRTVKCYLTGGKPSDIGITRPPNAEGYRGWHPQGFALGLADIDPEDGMMPCDCDACRAAYKPSKGGSICQEDRMTDLIWGKSVAIANRLKKEGVPGKIMQIAYAEYREPPKDLPIPDNLIVNVACGGAWAKGMPRWDNDLALLKRWYEACGRRKCYLHNYTLKSGFLALPALPSLSPRAVGEFYRTVAPYANGTYMESGSDRFAHIYLNIYIASKVMWNTSFDVEAALDEHHRLMFGPAAPEMKEFFDDLEKLWMGRMVCGRCEMGPLGPIQVVPSQFEQWRSIYSGEKMKKWAGLFEQAEVKAKGEGEGGNGNLHLRRVRLMKRNLFDVLAAARKEFADKTDVEIEEARRRKTGAKNLLTKDWTADFDVPKTKFEGNWETASAKSYVRIPYTFDKAKRYRLSYYLNAEDVTPLYNRRFCGAFVAIGTAEPNRDWGYTLGKKAVTGNTCGWVHIAREYAFAPTSDPKDIVLWLRGATGKMKVKGVLLEEIVPSMAFTQDRPDALYRVGETAKITVTVRDASGAPLKAGLVEWQTDNFGTTVFAKGKADLARDNPFTVSGTMKEPGFLRLKVKGLGLSEVWGVGFDVGKICLPELERPADFDAYWAGEKARLEKTVPLDAKCVLDEAHSSPRAAVYNLSFATFGGQRVYGFMSVPRDRAKGPFPVQIYVPGSGVGPNHGRAWGDNTVHVEFSVHMYEPNPDPKVHARLMTEQNAALAEKFKLPNKKSYCASAGLGAGRDDYYYHDVLLGINRAIDWLRAREFVDGGRVTLNGTSQGGYFTLALTYLNGNLTRSFAAVPAWSGMLGYKRRWDCGAPNIILAQAPENRAAAEANIRYYDGSNFAAGIKTPILFLVGFRDMTCQPPCVYSAFNACTSPDKRIINGFCGHHWMPWFYKEAEGVPTCIDPDKWLATGESIPFRVRK